MKQLLITIAAVVLVGCGESSINDAALMGNIEAVKQKLDGGVDVNAKGYKERTPLHWAASKGHKEIVDLLIAEGADMNAKNDDGETPIDWAIKWKHTETADLLRKHGGKTGEVQRLN